MPLETRNQRIAGTDIYIFSKDTQTGKLTYARPFTEAEARAVATATNECTLKKYTDIKGLQYDLGIDPENNALTNVSVLSGILANRELIRLSHNASRFPTLQEGFLLNQADLLPSDKNQLLGIVVYDANKKYIANAHTLGKEAKQKGYAFPLIASFKSLDLRTIKDGEVTPTIMSPEGIFCGVNSQALLNKCRYIGERGAFGIILDRGALVANTAVFAYSGCSIGFVTVTGDKKKINADLERWAKTTNQKKRSSLESHLINPQNIDASGMNPNSAYLREQINSLSEKERRAILTAQTAFKRNIIA